MSHTFFRSSKKVSERGWSGVYGWIGGSGIPLAPHHDVFLVTRQSLSVGAILLGYVCGVFLRHDNDNKFVAVDDDIRRSMTKMDIASFDETTYHEILELYPRVGESDGWFGAEVAFTYLHKKPLHD